MFQQISSDRILWDASDTPREAPIVVRDLYPEHTSPEVKLEEVVVHLLLPFLYIDL